MINHFRSEPGQWLEATNFLSSDRHIATHDQQVLRSAYVPKSVAHGVLLEHVLQGVRACMSACVRTCGRMHMCACECECLRARVLACARARMRARERSRGLVGGRARAHTYQRNARFHDAVAVPVKRASLP